MDFRKNTVGSVLAVNLLLLQGCGGSSSDSPDPTPEPIDAIAPVITLNGDAQIQHEQGTSYQDAGATANDNVDGTVNVTTTGEVGSNAATYTITYSASDASGNTASLTRTVIVADTIAPVITLNGESPMQITEGEAYQEPGATAVDVVDGAIDVVISGNVGQSVGNYQVSYTVADTAGNNASLTRQVEVLAKDTTPVDGVELVVMVDGQADSKWDRGLLAFDAALGYADCSNSQGSSPCVSIDWQTVNDAEKGQVLQISHGSTGELAGFFIGSSAGEDLTVFSKGALKFDIKHISGDSNFTAKLDCFYPCTSGDQSLGSLGTDGWQTVEMPIASLINAGLDITKVNTGIVIWASQAKDTVFLLDNVRFSTDTAFEIPPNNGGTFDNYSITNYGAGSISDTINPDSWRCVHDYGNWIYNAGIVEPGVADCNTTTGIPIGEPTKLFPHLTADADDKPTPTHKWWGSIPFMGEMTIGDANSASYITPDPIMARITNAGVRMLSIPSGLSSSTGGFGYAIPDPFSEVFDGIAVANSKHANMNAVLKDYSDGTVTVQWQASGTAVMEATFVYGSPYAFFTALDGQIIIKTLREDGGEKGTFYNSDNSLGVWTSVAGNHNNYLLVGEGATTFDGASSNQITVTNATNQLTVAYLPQTTANPAAAMSQQFEQYARNIIAKVNINYSVDRATNMVTVSHDYLDSADQAVTTMAGLMPLQWKQLNQNLTSQYSVRSARGVVKFAPFSRFDYSMPFVGVLPSLPSIDNSLDIQVLTDHINDFIAKGEASWNTHTDAYWSGKNYSKVSELIAISDSIGLTTQGQTLRNWLKAELADWFTAENNDSLNELKYFVYDDVWNTLLAIEESFMSHQQLNDHHFHYGYFVRAAAEICRVDVDWCSAEQYGPMIELLIRDYAGGRDDDMFPYLRNFDPANGFSWASGKMNFARGNNNESTSEAANAYGAVVLYGLITNNTELTERGMYLHASTTAAYWQYWNNIDGYSQKGSEHDNFPAGYDKITTSIIWGDGAVFSTWFSPAYAHILGIQGLPSNPLSLHTGLYKDYMQDYVALGLAESSNNKPSGLIPDQWRDIWWNLWAMVDPQAAINDYNSMPNYIPEAGETKAHTYHWIHTFNALGQVATGMGNLTADYPTALAFDKDGTLSYVVYNYGDSPITVKYSNGKTVTAQPGFSVAND
ncbi:glycosyl hydrolase [Paraferrimonas sp. SM1919]|uniref:glycosyl hydrolase n=1 Tax=Paraferrimonas sp. SM1919 TaxID=2662263 RepID=UPI0013D5AD10|nr:glycosyl hydrolase [Paraferrimonas sp. SM1919]